MLSTSPLSNFPLWLEWSGLPLHLNTVARTPVAWGVFRTIVEMDIRANGDRPGIVETTPEALAEACGHDAKLVMRAARGLRKAGVLRAFLPDAADDTALLQVVCPIPTPIEAKELLRTRPELDQTHFEDLRYASATPESEIPSDKLKRVVDLYLDVVSMRMNAFTLDELRMIADRYDEDLIKRVFERARKRERPSLSFILTQIRNEARRARGEAPPEIGVG